MAGDGGLHDQVDRAGILQTDTDDEHGEDEDQDRGVDRAPRPPRCRLQRRIRMPATAIMANIPISMKFTAARKTTAATAMMAMGALFCR